MSDTPNTTPPEQVDSSGLLGDKIVKFSNLPEVGSTWWSVSQKNMRRDYMTPYYEVIRVNEYWIAIQFHHLQVERPPHGITPKYFRSQYEPREDMESIHDPERSPNKS